jgi:hypothetical protein
MITPDRIADLLAHSPGWARVGLTAPDERLREQAAETLAAIVYENLDAPPMPCRDPRQLALL